MKKIFVYLTLSVLFSGCALLFSGSDQVVTFSSDPDGAQVIIDGQNRGETPLTVKLKKGKYESIRIEKKGYKTISRPLEQELDGIVWLNIFWDSSTTDRLSGAAWKYEPNSYHFKLKKESKWRADNGKLTHDYKVLVSDFVLSHYEKLMRDKDSRDVLLGYLFKLKVKIKSKQLIELINSSKDDPVRLLRSINQKIDKAK